MNLKAFTFNPFSENTYVLWAANGEGVIVDPGNFDRHETEELLSFVEQNQITIKEIILTHAHIDHVFGCADICAHFNVGLRLHKSDLFLLEHAEATGQMYGIPVKTPPVPSAWFEDGDVYEIGGEILTVLHTPGHSPGSVSFYSEKDNFVVSGDVLFKMSIGRTDLPMGNYEELIQSIRTRLLTLPDNCMVYSGHGPATEIGFEAKHNPFLV